MIGTLCLFLFCLFILFVFLGADTATCRAMSDYDQDAVHAWRDRDENDPNIHCIWNPGVLIMDILGDSTEELIAHGRQVLVGDPIVVI